MTENAGQADLPTVADRDSEVKPFSIALVGNPNVGKTSVFNRLTNLCEDVEFCWYDDRETYRIS